MKHVMHKFSKPGQVALDVFAYIPSAAKDGYCRKTMGCPLDARRMLVVYGIRSRGFWRLT